MCSVLGCGSWRRSAQRFKLPEDPEKRLEWVQFLATVNKQRFKESSWTDITICSEHFKYDCFENPTPSHLGLTGKLQLTLKASAVPSLCLQSESDEPQPNLENPKCVEPVETAAVLHQHDVLKATQGGPVPRALSSSSVTSDAFTSGYVQRQPNDMNIHLVMEKAALLKMKGKYIVNEKRLLQLFSCKCPSCGCKLKTEKVTLGLFIILNQQCLQCEYRNQWKSQVNTSIPTAEEQHLRGCTEVISETQKAAPTDDTHISITCVPEDVAVADEESESEVSSDQGDMDSDEDWKPAKHLFPTGVLQKAPGEETEDEDEEEDYDSPPPLPKHSQLCAECGLFFNRRWPHTCKHKIKPYPCNICGKRCVSEVALNTHSRIHDENYKHQCKYCQVTFKTKVDKVTHEQIHMTEGKPYKCPDCSETFATNKERKIHLEDHRGPKQLNCHICGMEFLWPLSLQRHLAVHTGVKPYKCSVCQRGFNQASHLKSHMRLHTGERPYKCQHCDKRFNHNVSLKSHVQRYHTSSSGHEQKEEETKESSTGDFQDNGIKRGAEPRLDNVDEEHDTEDEVLEERIYRAKKKRRSTGRPIGRPKSYASGNTVLAIEVEGQGAHTEAHQLQVEKLRRRQCSDEGSEDELTDSDVNFDSAEEEEERSQEAIKITERSGGKGKNSDSDSDFDPENSKEKRQRGQSLGKRRGRPRKHEVV